MAPLILVLSLHGCAVTKHAPPELPTTPQEVPQEIPQEVVPQETFHGVPEESIERNNFSVTREDEVIGRLAFMRLEKGDTLPDIARHFSLGIDEISAANPGVDMWLPEAEERITLPLSHIIPDCPRKGIVINLATMRLFQFKGDSKSQAVTTYPVGVGTAERPSPTGPMSVRRKTVKPTWIVPASIADDHRKKGDILPAKVLPGPQNPLGEFALYLSKPSYLIHGTNKPYSIGLNATNGCIRLYPEDVKRFYNSVPVNTPVLILNQPYLVGQQSGTVYIEVHGSPGKRDAVEWEKTLAKMRNIEKRSGQRIDWKKVEAAAAEARGVPVPVSEIAQGSETGTAEVVEVRHPEKLYGRPEIPELRTDAWYVSAATNLPDKNDALRLAAIINHQGPQIPARVLSKSNGYGVIAGPFNDINEARDATKRLKIDLEIKGIVVQPTRDR
jgi:L,D-transpeptidase ErfK/SrfK